MSRSSLVVLVLLFATVAGGSLLLRRGDVQRPGAMPGADVTAAVAGGEGLELHVSGIPDEVERYLRDGRAWRAARVMRDYLVRERDAPPAAYLLAARAEAAWGGWGRVRDYLEGRSWLDELAGGEGWYWLGRALEQEERWAEAARAYDRFLARPADSGAGDRRVVAELRRGLALLRLGEVEEGAGLLEGMREHARDITAWVDLLAAESFAAAGDTARVRALTTRDGVRELQPRARQALLSAYEAVDDPRGARTIALALHDAATSDTERAGYSLRAARAALVLGDSAAARADLFRALRTSPGSSAARQAVDLAGEMPPLTAAERLTIARVLDRHGADARAAAHYRAWLAADAGTAAEREGVRLALGRALFDSGRHADAAEVLLPLARGDGRNAPEALHLLARAEFQRGNRPRAMQLFEQLARRFPGSTPGSEGLFLVADLSHDARETGRAAAVYRRVASDFRGTDRAGLSLMRLAGMEYERGHYDLAARTWEEYRSVYPKGERWLQSTYWAGRAYDEAGDRARARERYRAVKERDPLSYYALRASERLGEPYWPLPMPASPPTDPAARARVEGWMHGVDLLREAGLHAEAEAEVARWVRRAGDDPALLYPLAEVLNERGFTIEGIRIGQRLQRGQPVPSERLLRILYPFPYRSMVAAEAREKDLDPFVVAALTRQESLFKARITSPVGARGLMQVMPATGAILARSAGIHEWDPELLYQPEINVHLGTTYLAEQMATYDGSLPSVFSAYNAGPHRVERWKAFPEYGNEELFTERIPYRETRDYVKILRRNIALYRGLYRDE